MTDRFYADINPRFQAGDRFEKRFSIFDAHTRRTVARDFARQYSTRRAAENCARRLSEIEIELERDYRALTTPLEYIGAGYR